MSEVVLVFLTVASIMALSFIGDMLSRRALLPNVILLIATGIIFGPILNLFNVQLFDVQSLNTVVPYLTPLTIAFIGFNSGIHTDLSEVMKQSWRALLLSILGFILSTVIVGMFLHFTFNLRWAYAFLLSAAWGGISTATVTAVCKHLKFAEKTKTTLIISSIVDDLIVLVTALTILNYIELGGMGSLEISIELMRNISVSFFLGVITGIMWLNIQYFTKKGEYTYTFTLAALLLVYSVAELLGGTGGIAIFLFGLILGNSKSIATALKMRVDVNQLAAIKKSMGKFHSELTFIITTFFFIFIGLLYVYTGIVELLLGLVISLLLHATRLMTSKIATWRSSLADDLPAMGLIVGKGAAAAAVSALPLAANLPNASLLSSIALNVILMTNIISIILPVLAARKKPKPLQVI
jgi:cell volume regulation protein A